MFLYKNNVNFLIEYFQFLLSYLMIKLKTKPFVFKKTQIKCLLQIVYHFSLKTTSFFPKLLVQTLFTPKLRDNLSLITTIKIKIKELLKIILFYLFLIFPKLLI